MLARSGEPHLLLGHKVPNHVRQDQRQKEPKHPISKELYEEIIVLDGFKFFTDCYFQFLSVMEKASILLPSRQLTQIFRHTFAAHFYDVGR